MNINESSTVEGKILILENEIKSLASMIQDLKSELSEKDKEIKALKIDQQRNLQANSKIKPGVAIKVAYDSNGLIVSGEELTVSDIPNLTIDNIDGLRKLLDDKVSISDVRKMISAGGTFGDSNRSKYKTTVGTGVKVHWNSEGSIVSASALETDDLPEIPISKISGLESRLSSIENYSQSIEIDKQDDISTRPGSYTKVIVDDQGRVTNGSALSVDDIPSEIISHINEIESKLSSLANRNVVDSLIKSNAGKVDSLDKQVVSGTYSKITVNKDGLVTDGSQLTVDDLPRLSIRNIDNLESTLRNKVDIGLFTTVSDTVSSLVNTISNVGEVIGIKSELETKAKDMDLKDLANTVTRISSILDNIISKLPNEFISTEVDNIKTSMDTILTRLSIIEANVLPENN